MKLFIVPTPIGNLKDITLRAIEVLKNVDTILCEDTRTSAVLLNAYDIKKKTSSYHQHNEHAITPNIIQLLQSGQNIALITDAGTPAISDPGFLLIRQCIANNIPVECLPGPTAFVPALVKSGIPSNRFAFEGFLPQKKGRHTLLKSLSLEQRTIVFYETSKKINHTIQDLLLYFDPTRKMSIIREISKMYENALRGTIKDLQTSIASHDLKGELVCIIEGDNPKKNNPQNLSPNNSSNLPHND